MQPRSSVDKVRLFWGASAMTMVMWAIIGCGLLSLVYGASPCAP